MVRRVPPTTPSPCRGEVELDVQVEVKVEYSRLYWFVISPVRSSQIMIRLLVDGSYHAINHKSKTVTVSLSSQHYPYRANTQHLTFIFLFAS